MQRKLPAVLLAAVLLALPTVAEEATWLVDVEDALAKAAKDDRYVLVDFYADWCTWCKVLEKEVFASAPFQEWARDFVLLRVDVEEAEGSVLQARFNAYSLPTVLLMDRSRAQVAVVPGYTPTADFLRRMESGIADFLALGEYFEQARAEQDRRPGGAPARTHVRGVTLQQLAEELHERADGRRAAEVYQWLERDAADPSSAAWLAYMTADSYRLAELYDKADETLARVRRLTQRDGMAELNENVELLSVRIAQDSGDCEAAAASLEHFLEAYPKSTYRLQARSALDALRSGEKSQQCA